VKQLLDVVLIAWLNILRYEVLVMGKYSSLVLQIGKTQDCENTTGHHEDKEELYR